MKLNKFTKSLLWSILNKYDGDKEYLTFCDSLSRIIQENPQGCDLLIVYNNLRKIDSSDKVDIDETIGCHIDYSLFAI